MSRTTSIAAAATTIGLLFLTVITFNSPQQADAPQSIPSPTITPAPQTAGAPPTPNFVVPTPRLIPDPTQTITPILPSDSPLPRSDDPTATDQAPATPSDSPIAQIRDSEWLEVNQPSQAKALKRLEWIADGVNGDEGSAVAALIATAIQNPDVFNAALRNPWLADDLAEPEYIVVHRLRRAAEADPELAAAMLEKPWFQDSIVPYEAAVIQSLSWIAHYQDASRRAETGAVAAALLNMPFLDQVTGSDALAVESLKIIARRDADDFLKITSHPKISDGITDQETKTIILLAGSYLHDPESVDDILQGDRLHWEERSVVLPISGAILISIIRTAEPVAPSIDFIEHSLRAIEAFMQAPLPTDYIAIQFRDSSKSQVGGTHYGPHIALSDLYDADSEYARKHGPAAIAHEAAHYYWNGNQEWLDEGAAELLASISEHRRNGAPVNETYHPCDGIETISELEAHAPENLADPAFRCNYALGEGLFLDLYHSLGEATFQRGFHALYQKSQREDPSDECHGVALEICHVRAAFLDEAPPETRRLVNQIITDWYGPQT